MGLNPDCPVNACITGLVEDGRRGYSVPEEERPKGNSNEVVSGDGERLLDSNQVDINESICNVLEVARPVARF